MDRRLFKWVLLAVYLLQIFYGSLKVFSGDYLYLKVLFRKGFQQNYLLLGIPICISGEYPIGGLLGVGTLQKQFAEVAHVKDNGIVAAGHCFLTNLPKELVKQK